MRRWGREIVFLCALGATACAHESGDDGDTTDADLSQPHPLAIDEDVSVLVEHPETLRALEQKGFDFGSRIAGKGFGDNSAFAASPAGAAIISAVQQDVADAKKADPQLGVGMKFDHRAFDASWLSSKAARFELVGVTNRLDKRPFAPDTCGEIHFVYRLAYSNKETTSRLPMTVMLVYPQAKDGADCTSVAAKWLAVADAAPSSAPASVKADALLFGPLAGLGVAPKVETNYQLLRWPSAARLTLGGHAEYSLRVFTRSGDSLAPIALDNTIREDLNDAERAALSKWVSENIADIDRGTAKIPEDLDGQHVLATHATSVSPKGLARAENRPFAIAFGKDGAGLGDVDLAGKTLVTSRAGLVRRLDTMSCEGCHQSQGIAGFHLVGHDRAETPIINALVQGISAHVREQVAFRKRDLKRVAGGVSDIEAIPFAERAVRVGAFAVEGGYGAACGLGDPGFATWTCGSGFSCSNVNGEDVGICVSNGKARPAGQACEESHMSFDPNSHVDTADPPTMFACALPNGQAGRCSKSSGGFPNGSCSGACATAGKVEGGGICGVSVPSGFNECVLAGKDFNGCASGGPKEYRLACNAKTPCSQDYVCVAAPGAPPGFGACMPPYFIFQARVDGHNVGP